MCDVIFIQMYLPSYFIEKNFRDLESGYLNPTQYKAVESMVRVCMQISFFFQQRGFYCMSFYTHEN